jgi:hypothetical protein
MLSACITSREPTILSPSLPLTLTLLHTCHKINPTPQTTLDSLFATFLLGINNPTPDIGTIYLRNFTSLLDLAGVYAIKHAAVLFPYLEGMLLMDSVAGYDKQFLLNLLQILRGLMANCWPRVPTYKNRIFQAAVSGVVGRGEKCDDDVVALVSDIIGMLKSCCGDKFKVLFYFTFQ